MVGIVTREKYVKGSGAFELTKSFSRDIREDGRTGKRKTTKTLTLRKHSRGDDKKLFRGYIRRPVMPANQSV